MASADPAVNGVWRFDRRTGDAARLPGTAAIGLPNGLAFDKVGTLFIADSTGAIWRVPWGGSASLVVRDDVVDRRRQPRRVHRRDGIAVRHGALIVTNTERRTMLAVSKSGDEIDVSARLPEGANPDGLALDVHGDAFLAINAQNAIGRVTPVGAFEIVVSGRSARLPVERRVRHGRWRASDAVRRELLDHGGARPPGRARDPGCSPSTPASQERRFPSGSRTSPPPTSLGSPSSRETRVRFDLPGDALELLIRARSVGVALDFVIVRTENDLSQANVLRELVDVTIAGFAAARGLPLVTVTDPAAIPGGPITVEEFYGWRFDREHRRSLLRGFELVATDRARYSGETDERGFTQLHVPWVWSDDPMTPVDPPLADEHTTYADSFLDPPYPLQASPKDVADLLLAIDEALLKRPDDSTEICASGPTPRLSAHGRRTSRGTGGAAAYGRFGGGPMNSW